MDNKKERTKERNNKQTERVRETGKDCGEKLQQESNKQEQNAHRKHLERVLRKHELFSHGIGKEKNAKRIPAIKRTQRVVRKMFVQSFYTEQKQ